MNKFTQNVKAILAKLKMTEKAQKKELSDDDRTAIAAAYKEEYGTDLDADADEARKTEEKAAALTAVREALDALDLNDPEKPEDSPKETAKTVVAALKENKEMKAQLNKAKADAPAATVKLEKNFYGGMHTPEHLFGIEHQMFSMEKRWNRITRYGKIPAEDASDEERNAFHTEFNKVSADLCARFRQLRSLGLVVDHKLGNIDYHDITSDTEAGTAWLVRRQDALIARIVALPSLNEIFPMRSNIQDGEIITNAFFDDFSQPYEAGEHSKGGALLTPEKARVSDVMFKYLIQSFKWIETCYLGYLNTSGSDPIKWNMIEWLILNIASKLQNERNERAILGYRVNPTETSDRHHLFSAFGLLHTLVRYYEGHNVLPFFGSAYQYNSASDIGDVLQAFVTKIAECVDNPDDYVIFLNARSKPMYREWYKTEFGHDANYQGVEYLVPYHDNKIVWVPNMGSSKFIVASVAGNLMQLENVPGEMTKIGFERHLESIWSYSVWKEGFSAGFSGRHYATAAELEAAAGKNQMIFMNWPALSVAADATTIDAGVVANTDNLFVTGANTAATVLTDIVNARRGRVYRIEIGDAAHPTSIAKSGKFSELSAAWTPTAKGEFIKVYVDANGKFRDVARG